MRKNFYTLLVLLPVCFLLVSLKTVNAQYCNGSFSNLCTSDDYINNITFNTLSNLATGCNGNPDNYIYYAPSGSLTTSVESGASYTITLQAGIEWPQGFGVWVDLNNDNDFDDLDEYLYASPNASTLPFTGTITIPSDVSYIGERRMRVRCKYNSVILPTEACATLNYGETEDYMITILPATSSMEYASSTVTQTNFNALGLGELDAEIIGIQVVTTGGLDPIELTSFTLNANGCTNFANDVDAVKIYYTGSSPVFSADQLYAIVTDLSLPVIVNATLSSGSNYFWVGYDISPDATIGNELDAECTLITMTGSAGSQVPSITAPAGARTINYCFPTYTNLCTSDDFIDNVTLNTLSNLASGCNGNTNNYIYYEPVGNLTTSLELGGNYTIALQAGQEYNQGFGVWIDFNDDLDFDDADEFVYSSPYAGIELFLGNVSIPNNSDLLGDHRMRIRCVYNGVPFQSDYCTNQSYGETEDYTISITPSTSMQYISATTEQNNINDVLAGSSDQDIISIKVTTSGSINAFNLTSLTINANGSTDFGSDVTNVKVYYSGAEPVYSTTTLFGSSADLSSPVTGNVVLVSGVNHFWVAYDISSSASIGNYLDAECTQVIMTGNGGTQVPSVTAPAGNRQVGYCTASSIYGCGFYYVDDVTLNTLSNTNTLCNGSSDGYIKYPASGSTTTTLELGVTYLLGLEGPQFSSVGFGVWIDYNNDGDFDDADEFVYTSPFYTTGVQGGEITVPNNPAYIGERRMRVREKDYNTVFDYESCTQFYFGETEDYTITISEPTNMVYQSSTTFQNNLNDVVVGQTDAEMMGIQISVTGSLNPFDVFAFDLTSLGSTDFSSDVTDVKVYSTGNSPVFSNTTFFGSSNDLSTPVFGAVTLNPGNNYFWVTYDVAPSATMGNNLDVTCDQIQFAGAGNQVPTITAPVGVRQIGYCTAASTYGCIYYYIDDVELNTLSNVNTGCNGAANGYTKYPATGSTTTSLEIGSNYPISLQGPVYSPVGFGVWIDFNGDGDFDDADEFVFSSPTYVTGVQTGLITVPDNAAYLGERRMRIREKDYGVVYNTESCTLFYYGETEDYTITLVPATAMVFSSATSIQNNLEEVQIGQTDVEILGISIQTNGSLNPFNLTSVTLNSNGTTAFAADVTGVKVYYTAGSPVFSNATLFGSAANLASPITGSIALTGGVNYFWLAYDISSAATLGNLLDAECTSITLSGSGGTHVPDVTAPDGSREINYCVGSYVTLCTSDDYINNFTLNTLSNLNSGCNGNADNYINYAPTGTLTTTMLMGGTYDLTVQAGIEYNQGFGIWIDYNNDASFGGADEFVYASPGYGTSVFSGTITIPNIASYAGEHRMRVRCIYNSTVPFDGYCNLYNYGETEDYTITIEPQPACTGTPEPATLNITPDEFCIEGTTASLTLVNYPLASGIVLEWQESPNGSSWTAIPGVTGYTYTTPPLSATAYYRVKITCTITQEFSYTNTASITLEQIPDAPTAVDALHCGPGTVVLTADGSGGDLNWYDQQTGGVYLGSGSPFTTPYITGTTTFYVEESVGAAPASPLTTTFLAGNGSYGNMFDVTALNNVEVSGFDGHLDLFTSANIAVYYKQGTHVGFENNAAAWTLAATASGVTGAGIGQPTPYPLTMAVNIPAGETYAFYITTTNSVIIQYTNGTGTGNVFVADDNVQIKEGKGIEYPFGLYFEPRVWNGTMHYKTTACASDRVPVKAVIYHPEIIATASETSICAGETISLDAQNTGLGDFNYQWGPVLSGMIPANGQAATVTVPPAATTNFTVTATELTGQCDTAITINVQVLPLPVVQLSGLNNTYEVIAPSVTLSGTPSGGTFSGTGVTGNIFNPAAAGVGGPYVISYTYTDGNGCTGVDTQHVTVTLPVGIDEVFSEQMVSIYPNPGEGMFMLDIKATTAIEQLNCRITNVVGQIIYEETLNLHTALFTKSYDFSAWAKGTYYIEMNADGQLIRKKVIIQ